MLPLVVAVVQLKISLASIYILMLMPTPSFVMVSLSQHEFIEENAKRRRYFDISTVSGQPDRALCLQRRGADSEV